MIRARYTRVLASGRCCSPTRSAASCFLRGQGCSTLLSHLGEASPHRNFGWELLTAVESGGCRDCFAASIVSIVLSLDFRICDAVDKYTSAVFCRAVYSAACLVYYIPYVAYIQALASPNYPVYCRTESLFRIRTYAGLSTS